jgi:hypothetical protein
MTHRIVFLTGVVMQKNQNCAGRLAVSLRELADQGSLVDLSAAGTKKDEPTGIEIEQVGGVLESSIFELRGGLTGYMVCVAVTNQTSQTIYCRDVELRVFWEDSLFQWMLDPRETRGSERYRFPGRGSPELPRDQVINHVLLEGGALTPKHPLEGWLLATGRPMPENVRNRQTLDATLAIYASNRIEYTETIRLWTERLAIKPKFAPRGKYNLFGEPVGDGPSGHVSPSDRCFDDGKAARERGRASQLTI